MIKIFICFFLQQMDDITYTTLEAVDLTAEEKEKPELFVNVYKNVIYGDESIPLKNEFITCKQESDENVEEFAFKLQSKGKIAFTDNKVRDENCLLSFIRGVRSTYIKRKLNESSLSDFNEALKLAKKLEKVDAMLENEKPQINSILKEQVVTFSPSNNGADEKLTIEDPPKDRSRKRDGSHDSRYRSRSRESSHSRERWPNRSGSNNRNSSPDQEGRNFRSRSREISSSKSRNTNNSHSRESRGSNGQFDNKRIDGNRGRYENSFRNFEGQNFSNRERPSQYRRPDSGQKSCWLCGKIGHYKRTCWRRQRNNPPRTRDGLN